MVVRIGNNRLLKRPAYVCKSHLRGRCCFIAILFEMTYKKDEALSLTVMEGLQVTVLANISHEFLMTTQQVAVGYGTSDYIIRKTKERHDFELTEGKHYVKGVTLSHGLPNAQPHQIFWTKRGIVRLGFFIKSERAKLFRDWAEELIIRVDEQADLFGNRVPDTRKALPHKRNHNRLTSERLIRLLALTHRIENSELRTEIVNELMGGRAV